MKAGQEGRTLREVESRYRGDGAPVSTCDPREAQREFDAEFPAAVRPVGRVVAVVLTKRYRDYCGLFVERAGGVQRIAGGPFLFCLHRAPKDGSPFAIEHLP